MISLNLFERIMQLAREGLGYEDIAATLNLPWREVRPLVIRGKHGDVSSLRLEDTANERKAEKL